MLEAFPTEGARSGASSQELKDEDQSDEVDTWSKLLFDQALVAEGSLPEDPANFARAITTLMQKAVK